MRAAVANSYWREFGARAGRSLKLRAPEVAGAGLAALFAAAVWLGLQYNNQLLWVQHSLQVEKELGSLLTAVQQAETGQRGYLLTNDESFLAPYRAVTSFVPAQITKVESLIRDNPGQQQALVSLRSLIETRLASLQANIERKQAGTLSTADLREGSDAMRAIRARASEMLTTEAALLADGKARSSALMSSVLAAGTALGLASIATIFAWVTSSRRTAAELQESNRALIQAIAEREEGESKIRHLQKMEAIGQLTGGLAHDFNNMMSVVIGALRLAERRLAKGETNVKDLLDGATDGATRAANLTKRLLAFSRQQALAPQVVVPNSLVSGMSDLIMRTLGGTIRTETVLAAGAWPIHVDPPLLENAILNLCLNARDAMPDGGKLTIETLNAHLDDQYAREHGEVTAGQYVMIAISDSGTGMTRDVAERAFDPFFSTKGAGKGTGLGLSQVHGFVKQSGGHIKIYSEPGTGTTIKMYFPRFIGGNEPTTAALRGTKPRGTSQGEVVLVVEDEPRVREIHVSMLEELGYSTLEAENASAALRQLDSHPDVVLMFTDIVMPDMNGRKLADEAMKRWPHLKVLYTTGFTRNAVVHNGTLDPGVHLLQKPFSIEELHDKVRELLAAKS